MYCAFLSYFYMFFPVVPLMQTDKCCGFLRS
nr:MAG TPA: hypothetical protein [Caudoviricetes sp.]